MLKTGIAAFGFTINLYLAVLGFTDADSIASYFKWAHVFLCVVVVFEVIYDARRGK